MKEVTGKKRVHVLFSHKIDNRQSRITDTETVAEAFNNFFVTIGPSLASKF